MEAILKAIDIEKEFDNHQKVLKGMSYSVLPGTFNVILGQSGSGKSTLLSIISGLMNPTKGQVYVNQKDLYSDYQNNFVKLRRNDISNIFQDYLLLPDLTVKENIELGRCQEGQNLKYEDIVEALGIKNLEQKFPYQLSGGQQQRVAIARSIIKKPSIIFCDEATGALDEENSKAVVALLHDIKNKYGTAVVFTTHNSKIGKTADRITILRDGLISEDYLNKNPKSPYDINWGVEL